MNKNVIAAGIITAIAGATGIIAKMVFGKKKDQPTEEVAEEEE